MNNILELKNITKKYYSKTAIEDINLTFVGGNIYGLLGPNGCGKTTLLKILAGLHKPTSGNITLNNKKLTHLTKTEIAFLPTENFIYDQFKVKQAIKYFKDMYNDFDEKKAINIITDYDLNLNTTIKSLSSGQVAKLKIALTVSRNAQVYIFDEPLNGIDVITKDNIVNCIIDSYTKNKIIIISSHMVEEIEKIFDEVIFIKNSRVELCGITEQLRSQYQKSITNIFKEVYK